MHAGTEDRVQMESELHHAVELKQFELYLPTEGEPGRRGTQPGGADSMVAPKSRSCLAGEFIPLAEDWRFDRRYRRVFFGSFEKHADRSSWQDEGVPSLRISAISRPRNSAKSVGRQHSPRAR